MKSCVRVKICGITNLKDALSAGALGAWAVGFIFYKKSPRVIPVDKAAEIIAQLPPFVTPVGVFVNEPRAQVKKIAYACGLRALQFHGDESPDYCRRFKGYKIIKAVRIHPKTDIKALKAFCVDALLLDTYQEDLFGGTGKSFNWAKAKQAQRLNIPIILSGGLNPQNICRAVKTVKPYAVDIASGVESRPGKKNPLLLKSLFSQIQSL